MRTASPTLTRITRCVPPFRSRPRLIGSGLFDVGMTATTKATSTPRINTTFQITFLFKSSSGKTAPRLFSVAGVDHTRNGRTRDFDFYILGNLQVNDVGLNTLNRSVNPAAGEDSIAFFQRAHHLLLLAPLLVRRRDHEEVKNESDGRDGQDVEEEGDRAVAGLEQSNRMHDLLFKFSNLAAR